MKIKFVFILMITFTLFGCSKRNGKYLEDFIVNSHIYSIGASNEIGEQQKYTFALCITSQTEKIDKVKQILPITGDQVKDLIVSNELTETHINMNEDNIKIQGEVVFNAKTLTKEQIVDLGLFVTTLKIITDDDAEYIIELRP